MDLSSSAVRRALAWAGVAGGLLYLLGDTLFYGQLTNPGAGACVLSFTKRDGDWRLTGMQAHEMKIELAPPPRGKRP